MLRTALMGQQKYWQLEIQVREWLEEKEKYYSNVYFLWESIWIIIYTMLLGNVNYSYLGWHIVLVFVSAYSAKTPHPIR